MLAGDVVLVDFGIPEGSEPGFGRPAIVVTASAVLESGPRTVHVVPTTTNVDRDHPTDVPVGGLPQPSVAQVHLLTVIGVSRIREQTDMSIGPEALHRIRSVAADLLDI